MDKISTKNYDKIYSYSCSRKEINQFWHDQGWLISSVYYLYEIKDRVLYIYRDIPYNKTAFFLAIPPMTLDLDYEKEYNSMLSILKSGISIRFSDEHLELYKDFDINKLKKELVQTEYVYYSDDYSPETLAGKKGSHYRNAVNWFKKNGYKWYWVQDDPFSGTREFLGAARKVTKEWAKKKVDGSKFYHLNKFKNLINARALILKDSNGIIQGWNVSQQIGNTVMYASEKFLPVYHRQLKAIHLKLAEFWRNELGYDVYMNKGASVGLKGMEQAKKSVRPNKELKIWKVKD